MVFEPEDVETGFISLDDVGVAVLAPASFRVAGFIPGGLSIVSILGVVAVDEVLEICQGEGPSLEGVVNISAVVVDPDVLGPGLGAGGVVVEEEDVGFDSVGVEDACGETKDRVEVGGL